MSSAKKASTKKRKAKEEIDNESDNDQQAKESNDESTNKKNKSSNDKNTFLHKIISVLEDQNTKVSLASLKKHLNSLYGYDFKEKRNVTLLKNNLDKGEQDNKIKKIGGSYALPNYEEPQGDEEGEGEGGDNDGGSSGYYKKGIWRGLTIVSKGKAKTDRSKCGGCNKKIDKDSSRLEVVDDSLFKAVDSGGHEGSYRGYVEGMGSKGTISREKFFIHAGCLDLTNKNREQLFYSEWEEVKDQLDYY